MQGRQGCKMDDRCCIALAYFAFRRMIIYYPEYIFIAEEIEEIYMRRYCRRRICNVFTPKPYFHVAPAYAGVKFGLAPRQYAGVKRLLTPN